MHVTYTGERVRLRPFRDADELWAFASAQFITCSPYWGVDWHRAIKSRSRFQRSLEHPAAERFCIERLDTGESIGWVSAHVGEFQLAGSVGTEIAPEHWSRGFGREAKLLAICHLFENFAIESVYADTLATHQRARAGLHALGFRLAGLRRTAFFNRGSYIGRVLYQLLREDWEAMDYRHRIERGA